MRALIKLIDGHLVDLADRFSYIEDADSVRPGFGPMILGPMRYRSEGRALLESGREIGIWLEPDDAVEALVEDLASLAVVVLKFPKFRDGRAYSSATLLRERYGYSAELRAIGDVLRDQAGFLVRAGFDAFEPADGSTAADWQAGMERFRHVYQRSADRRRPAFLERQN